MRETSLIFGACGGLLGIGILFILINFTRADFNITNRYFGDFHFSKRFFPFCPTFSKNHQTFFIAIQKYSAGHTSTHQSRHRRSEAFPALRNNQNCSSRIAEQILKSFRSGAQATPARAKFSAAAPASPTLQNARADLAR
jgi:hypothetical protein